jgi:PAS domain S-box-containing protein
VSRAVRVLYAEDNAQDADLTRAHFSEHARDLALELVGTGQECLAALRRREHDVLLLDHHLPDMDGLDVLRDVIRSGAPLPVVLVTGAGDEELVVKALRLGAASYVPKVGDYVETLPGLLRAVVEEHRLKRRQGLLAAAPRRILYIEHHDMDVELTQRHFAEASPHVDLEVVRSFGAALERLARPPAYDAAVIDLRMPGQSGLDFVRDARRRGVSMPPFIILTGKGDEATALAALKLGAADYVTKRQGYLEQLESAIDRAIAHARVERLAAQLQAELLERRRVEAERERLAEAVEQAGEMIMITDARGVIQYVNPAFETTTGWTRGEIVGQNPRVLKSEEHDASFFRTLWETISSGRVWRGRLVNKRKDGQRYTEEGTISPVRDATGAIASYVAVKRDITRDLELQAQFLQAQRMEGIGRLAGGIAHDFNNLLSVILTYTDFALKASRGNGPLEADLEEVLRAADRAVALTRQLLAFSRKQLLQPVPLDLNGVATGIEKMLRRMLGEDVRFAQVLAPDLGVVRADPGQIEQVIMNLAVNARDAMPTGGQLTLETSNVEIDEEYAGRHLALKPGPYVQLAVTDTGCGMDEPTRARLFEPFFTTKDKGKGTGLGLSTVYGIVKQSGGDIWVYSEVGRGTTFKIYFPRELSATAVAAPRAPASVGQVTGTETVLVVEDEEVLRRASRRALEVAGYTVLAAADGDEALQLAARHAGKLDLLLTDVVLPRVSGQALARELAATWPTIKVLFTSGYTDDTIVHHGVLEPGVHFLSKPFTAADLTRKVREVLDGGGAPSSDPAARPPT